MTRTSLKLALASAPGPRWGWRWLAPLFLALQVLTACTGQGVGVTPTAAAGSPTALGATASPAATGTASANTSPAASSPAASGLPASTAATPASTPAGSSSASPASSPSQTNGNSSSATPQQLAAHDADNGSHGGKNYVIVRNTQSNNLKIRGNVQLNKIPGSTAAPENLAYAYSSCVDCQTFAVALQVNLISKHARVIAPQNVALAVNERCTRCKTVARAIQYNVQVDNPTEEPEDVKDLLREMDKTLNEISREKGLTADQAEQRINAVIDQFRSLSSSLYDQRNEDDGDNGKPTPSPVPTLTPTPTGTVPANPTATTGAPGAPSPTPNPGPATTSTPTPTKPTPAATGTP